MAFSLVALLIAIAWHPGAVSPRAAADPRAIASAAQQATERNDLVRWTQTWRAQLRRAPNDRAALFAIASAERLHYRYRSADSLYNRVITLGAADHFSRQAQIARIGMGIVQGRLESTNASLITLEQSALLAGDTLAALDVILIRSSRTLRTIGVSAALAVMARGDSLSWNRDPVLDATARCRLASIKSRAGARDDARRLAREGLELANRSSQQRIAANCLFVLATEFALVGLSDSLRAPLLQSMEIQQRTNDMLGLAGSAQWAGFYNISLGQFPSAQRYLVTAWNAAHRSGSADGMAWTALNRASLALLFFDASGNALWLGRADSLMRALGDIPGQIQVLRQRARIALASGDEATAQARLRDALGMAERIGDPQIRMSIIATITEVALDQGRLDDAAAFLRLEQDAIDRYRLTGWRGAYLVAQAKLALRRGDGNEAERLLRPVIDSIHPSQHLFRYQVTTLRALAASLAGDSRRAAGTSLDAANAFDRWRASLNDSVLRLYTVQSQRESGFYLSTLVARLADAGETRTAFELTERRRARDLRDKMLLAAAWQPRSDSMQPFDEVSRSQQTFAGDSLLSRAAADASTALVIMNMGEHGARGTAFVYARGSLTAHPLPSADTIAPRVRRLVTLLEAGRNAEAESRILGEMLMAPIMTRLESGKITRVVVVPDGVLHRLPFDALRLGDGSTVLERFETSVAPSVSVLAQLQRIGPLGAPSARVLAIADPTHMSRGSIASDDASLGDRLLSSVFGERALPRLVGSRAEVERVRRAMPATSVRTGGAATESSVRREANVYGVLHFATHAVVDEWSGARAALVLSNEQAEDGLLDSGEISLLRLRAPLVVLSACRTVGGEVVAGEGVRGLTSAFLQAGAQAVVATSWRVNDRAVVPLVGDFYDNLSRGFTVAAALREAKLRAQRRGASASEWAAFTLVGNASHRVTRQ